MHLIERLLREQGRKHAKAYVVAFAMMGVIAACTTLSAYIMKYIIDRIFVDRSIEAMWMIGGAIVTIYVTKGFATYGQVVVLTRVANNIVAEIQTRIFDKMLALDMAFYNRSHSTEFIARQAFISSAASGTLNMLITALGRDILTTIGLTFAMLQQDPVLALLAIVIMPGAIVGVRKLGHKAKKVMMTEFAGFSAILESLQETAQGIRVVKSYTLEPFMRERQQESIRSFEAAANKLDAGAVALQPADGDFRRHRHRRRRGLWRLSRDLFRRRARQFLRLHHRPAARDRTGQAHRPPPGRSGDLADGRADALRVPRSAGAGEGRSRERRN